jgi:phage shock protein C
MKKLTRSSSEKIICGVCSGIAKYFECDPMLIRAIWVVGTIVTAVVPCCIAYLALTILLPYDNEVG